MTPPRLTETNGWVNGIAHHPTPNRTPGGMVVPGGIRGLIGHTMVGNLPGTDSSFMQSSFQASAHFGNSQSGELIQWASIRGDRAWAEMAGNSSWYSIESADNQDPRNPYTQEQINVLAQILELTSRVGNFPLQIANSPGGMGFGTHWMGGAAWGGHTCPDPGSWTGPRSKQRQVIVDLAKAIRAGSPTPAPAFKTWTTAGQDTLCQLARQLSYTPSTLLGATLLNSGQPLFGPFLAAHINAVFAADEALVPAGTWFDVPGFGAWTTKGMLSLADLARQNNSSVSSVLAASVEAAPSKRLPAPTAKYVDGVFARTSQKPPAGTILHY